jgi:hypothetical protein
MEQDCDAATAPKGTAVKKPSVARQTPSPRRRRPSPVFYVFRIRGWDWSFSFGASHDAAQERLDYRHLIIKTEVLRPKALRGNTVEVACLPDPRVNEGVQTQVDLTKAGMLDFQQPNVEARLTTPADILPAILQVLIASRFRYIVAEIGPPREKKFFPIVRYSFEQSIANDDLPPEEP